MIKRVISTETGEAIETTHEESPEPFDDSEWIKFLTGEFIKSVEGISTSD